MTNHDGQLRVVFICDRIAAGGGPPGYTFNLLSGFQDIEGKTRITTSVWGRESDERNRSTALDKSEPHLAQRSAQWAWRRIRGLPKSLDEALYNADVAVFHGYQSPARIRRAKKIGVVTVYMPHSPTIMSDEYRANRELNGQQTSRFIIRFLRRAENSNVAVADHIVFPSQGASEQYRRRLPAIRRSKVHFLPSGVPDPLKMTRVPNPGISGRRVLFVGRYVDHKGYDLFLQAAEQIGNVPDLHFATLGDGPAKRASPVVHDLGWSDRPHSIIEQAQLVVVPNRVAYYDLLPLEAAALGKPIVFTRAGGSTDQAALLPDSILCEPGDLATAILRALKKIDELPTWGTANRAAYESTFTPAHLALRWQDLLLAVGSR